MKAERLLALVLYQSLRFHLLGRSRCPEENHPRNESDDPDQNDEEHSRANP